MAFVQSVIPQMGLGTSGIKSDEVIIEALRQGYRHIDTGSWYGTHGFIKSALEKTAKDIPRSDIYITTKIWVTEQRDVPGACEKALKELGIDYIDCYLTHFPYAILPDATDFDFISRQEVWTQMEKLVDNGKVKSIGVSNHTVALSIDMMAYARIKPIVNQYEANPYCQRKALTRLMQRFGIQPVAFTPIGGKREPAGQPTLRQHPVLQKIGEKYNASASQVSLAWNLQRGVCVIPKSADAGRLRENFQATQIQLSAQDVAEIEKLECGFMVYTDMLDYSTFEHPHLFE